VTKRTDGGGQWRRRAADPAFADLSAVATLTVLTVVAVFAPVVSETPIRTLLGLTFVLFAPGYALVAALFPERGDGDDGIDGVERLALSLGTSIAVVPLIGLGLNFTPWGIRLVPIVVALTVVVAGLLAIAARRRAGVQPEERFCVPYRSWVRTGRSELLEPEGRLDATLNIVLVLSMILAVASVSLALTAPPQGESFSELYLLTENESGDLVADDYPESLVQGESEPFVVGIGNHEHEPKNYTAIVQLQRVENTSEGIRVTETEDQGSFRTRVSHGDTHHDRIEVQPTMTGERLRLAVLLYRGGVPEEPTYENAYRTNHIWVSVNASASS